MTKTNTEPLHPGIDLDSVTFDPHGEADGIDEHLLGTISGGLADDKYPNGNCEYPNGNCE